MMVNITNKNIFMTKGDTVKLSIVIKDKNNAQYTMQIGDHIIITVRKPHSLKDEFSITSEDNNIVIDKDMTSNMKPGVYEYDVQLTFENGEVNTIVPLHKFVIQKEVS